MKLPLRTGNILVASSINSQQLQQTANNHLQSSLKNSFNDLNAMNLAITINKMKMRNQ